MNRALSFVALTLTFLGARAAHAQPAEPPAWAEAAKLLDEGRVLMSKPSTLAKGCEILEQSYSLRKRGDTLLNLAECHRRQGKTATAWREFDEAIRYAEEAEFNEAIKAARVHRDELAKTLSELIVQTPTGDSRPPGLEVLLDGRPLPEQQWGEILYVDPGKHFVTAAATDHHPFSGSVEVVIAGERSVVVVKLEPLPPKPVPKPPPPKPPPPKIEPEPEVPIWAIVVGSVGIAAMGVSAGFLADSVTAGDELDLNCGGEERIACLPGYPYGDVYDREVRSFGLFVGLGASGLIAAGVGAVGLALGLTTPPSPVALQPWLGPEGGGVAGSLRF